MAREDRDRLDGFARRTFDVLVLVVNTHPQWLPADLVPSYESGLSGAESSLGEMRRRLLAEAEPPEPWLPPVVDRRLELAGLTGRSLDHKLRGFERALDRFDASPSRRLLRSVLRWADVILGSIVAALGVGEALKEFKETVEAGLEDEEDDAAAS